MDKLETSTFLKATLKILINYQGLLPKEWQLADLHLKNNTQFFWFYVIISKKILNRIIACCGQDTYFNNKDLVNLILIV